MAKEKTYRIGDACSRVDIQPYVLRYWETEFPPLSPDKSQSGQRLYTERDIQVIQRIKELLYDEGYTIAGAKKKLESELEAGGPARTKTSEAAGAKTSKASSPSKVKREEATSKAGIRKRTATRKKGGVKDDDADKELLSLKKGVQKVLAEARSLLEELES